MAVSESRTARISLGGDRQRSHGPQCTLPCLGAERLPAAPKSHSSQPVPSQDLRHGVGAAASLPVRVQQARRFVEGSFAAWTSAHKFISLLF